jgi:hypothetical protein
MAHDLRTTRAAIAAAAAANAAALAEADAALGTVGTGGGGASDPPPPSTGTQALLPVVPNQMLHHQFGRYVDYVPAAAARPAAIPWDRRLLADAVNGVLAPFDPASAVYPVRRPMFLHLYGLPTELYDELPDWLPDGRPEPFNSEFSDHIAAIGDSLRARPPRTGPRGIGQPTPYAVWAPHPHKTSAGAFIPAAVRPSWTGVSHGAHWLAIKDDGSFDNFGQIEKLRYVYDYCPHPTDRTKFFLALPGDSWNGQAWSNPRFVLVDRTPGKLNIATGKPEDATLFTVTTLLAGVQSATAITCDEAGNWYGVDHLAGKIYRNGVLFTTLAGAFAIRYDRDPAAAAGAAGTLYVVTNRWESYALDAVSGAIGPQLTPAAQVSTPFAYGADFFAVSIDRGQTWWRRVGGRPAFSIARVHTGGNINVIEFRPNAAGAYDAFFDRQIWSDGQSWQQIGDLKLVHEPDHYDWNARDYHSDQRARLMSGYGNSVLAVVIAGELLTNAQPALTSTGAIPAELADYSLTYYGKRVLAMGNAQLTPNAAPLPSLTCLMSVGGWPASDLMTWQSFDELEAWVRAGCGGSFPRPDFTPVQVYALITVLLQNSQRYLIEGVACIRALRTWYAGKFGALPAAPVNGQWPALPLQFGSVDAPVWMEVRELATPGHVQVCGFNNGASTRTRYNLTQQAQPIVRPGAGASLIVNPLHPDAKQQRTVSILNAADVDLTGLGLPAGLHAVIVDTAGAYPTRPCVVRLP